MEIPRRLWRFWTGGAIDKLASRFGLPNEPGMQDWPYQVADPERINEFLAAYQSGGLSDDERFCLMEMVLESFRGSGEIEQRSARWQQTLNLIEQNVELHAYTVCYWASLALEEGVDINDAEYAWECAPDMRGILNRHRSYFSYPFRKESDCNETN